MKDPYKGKDFKTRHKSVHDWDYADAFPDLFHDKFIELDSAPNGDQSVVNLYQSNDWENLLLGMVHIQNKQFHLEARDFIKESPAPLKSIHLINPPTHLREFNIFWQQALQKGQFSLYGKHYELAKDFVLTYSVNNEIKTNSIVAKHKTNAAKVALNPNTFNRYFQHYQYTKESFEVANSLFSETKNKAFNLLVTDNLSLHDWIRLLEEADKHRVTLSIQIAQGVSLPDELKALPHTELKVQQVALVNKHDLTKPGITVLQCPENSAAIAGELLRAYDKEKVKYLTLDEVHNFGDLVYSINASLTQGEIIATFQKSDIWKMLEAGKTVIVEGNLSGELLNALAPMLLSGKNEIEAEGQSFPYTGKLIFVTSAPVSFAKNQLTCKSVDELQKCLSISAHNDNKKPALFNNYRPTPKKQDAYDLTEETYRIYKENRFKRIMDGFEKSPIIFYSGPTGIGKTTYILEEFLTEYQTTTKKKAKFYVGEASIDAYMQHQDANVEPILVIDEANLSSERLSFLAGRLAPRPNMLRKGRYSNVAGKILLMGNPIEYGGARQQQEFFANCTQEVKCERPPHAYHYHAILKEQLEKTLATISVSTSPKETQPKEQTIALTILKIFDKINELANKPDPFFTPRHLHMIGMVFDHYASLYNEKFSINDLAIASCLTILGDSLPDGKDQLLKYLSQEFSYNHLKFENFTSSQVEEKLKKLTNGTLVTKDKFTFTKSRFPMIHLIDTFLALRKKGGLQFGLAFEGSTSLGKSEILHQYLELLPDLSKEEVLQMSLGVNFETDQQAILNAENKKQILVIDEINAGGPRYEQALNKSITNGLLVFTTQNSLKMEGRQALSAAIRARFVPITVPKYTNQELQQIIENKMLPDKDAKQKAKKAVEEYHKCLTYVKNYNRRNKGKDKITLLPKLRTILNAFGLATKKEPARVVPVVAHEQLQPALPPQTTNANTEPSPIAQAAPVVNHAIPSTQQKEWTKKVEAAWVKIATNPTLRSIFFKIHEQITSLEFSWNPLMTDDDLREYKIVILESLQIHLANNIDSDKTVNEIINDFLNNTENSVFKKNASSKHNSDTPILNKNILTQHRFLFFSRKSSFTTDTMQCLEDIQHEHGNKKPNQA